MNCKYTKIFIVLGGVALILLAIPLVFSIHKWQQYSQMFDSVQARNELLEEKIQDKKDFYYLSNYILFTGDTSAYKDLCNDNYGYNLLCSMYMADHYGFPYAYHAVYSEIAYRYKNFSDSQIKDKAIQMAIDYLREGARLNNWQCAGVLAGMYIKGEFVPQDTILGRKYLEQMLDDKRVVDIFYKKYKGTMSSFFFQE